MAEQTATGGAETVGEVTAPEITLRRILTSMGAGFLGLVLMQPLLVGVPWALNLFRPEPLVAFATFADFAGSPVLSPSVPVGIAIFVLGGAVVLPLAFVVVGAFLPPASPRWVRGVTFGTIFWTGFVPAFWPGGDAATVALFLVVSLLGHWVYGATLGYGLDRLSGIPDHDV